MPTRLRNSALSRVLFIRVFSALLTLGLLASLASCDTPRYAGKAESEASASPCETAYYTATDASDIMGDTGGRPFAIRLPSALIARNQWIEVAAQCTDRFGEGVLRAAQADYAAGMLAERLGVDVDAMAGDSIGAFVSSEGLADIEELSAGQTSLNAMALAEDRAGFTVEILTARGSSGATLAISDNHKSTAGRLVSLAGTDTDDDPRQKVYDVSQLLADPESIIDPATGLRAPTFAVAEINCVREEIAAMGGNGGSEDSSGDADGTEGAGVTNDTGSANTTGSADTTEEGNGRTATLRILARLIASRAVLAFNAGYPAFDHALFE